ncbi:hypothetical protein D1007_00647 [Hordeum vulgare]|nr:hypothetical protein D1007_00647 [Hordeum vulgare]KAI5007883.1 hypothetical protein ZWY2020_008931 [Hordeum vulgare]
MDEVALNVEVDPVPEMNGQRWVEWLIFATGFTTASMAVAAALYKAPAGIFDGHRLAYYASVVSAGAAGLAEAFAAMAWMSGAYASSEHAHRGHARRCVLYASFVPLAFMAGLGGVRILFR